MSIMMFSRNRGIDKNDSTKHLENEKLRKRNSWPLPSIGDLLDQLRKSKYFTFLDLKSWYWQISMNEHDGEKTTIFYQKGLSEQYEVR